MSVAVADDAGNCSAVAVAVAAADATVVVVVVAVAVTAAVDAVAGLTGLGNFRDGGCDRGGDSWRPCSERGWELGSCEDGRGAF